MRRSAISSETSPSRASGAAATGRCSCSRAGACVGPSSAAAIALVTSQSVMIPASRSPSQTGARTPASVMRQAASRTLLGLDGRQVCGHDVAIAHLFLSDSSWSECGTSRDQGRYEHLRARRSIAHRAAGAVAEAVVQAVLAVLPELPLRGRKPVAAPVLGERRVRVGVAGGQLRHARLQPVAALRAAGSGGDASALIWLARGRLRT